LFDLPFDALIIDFTSLMTMIIVKIVVTPETYKALKSAQINLKIQVQPHCVFITEANKLTLYK
jgi:hypothetical protein